MFSRLLQKKSKETLFCFPEEGLAKLNPYGFPLSLLVCSKLSSWGLLTRGSGFTSVTLELPKLEFIPRWYMCGKT
jgi:hypothetical protein